MMKAPLIRLCSLLIFFGVSVVHAQTQERIVKLTFDQAPTEDSPWFYHRMTTARRTAKLTENGGSGTTERSVLAALRWLKNKQAPDGSWPGGTSEGAATGLATLAFLGHGETPASPEFGTTVSRALEFLAALVAEDGGVIDHYSEKHKRKTFRGSDGGYQNVNMYVQAIVTEALAEGYGMTQCSGLRYPMERACDLIIKAQAVTKFEGADGGWRYTPLSRDSDLSVSSWQIMALKLGRHASSSVPRELLEKALAAQWSFRVLERNPIPVREKADDGTKPGSGQKGIRPVFHVPNEVFEKAQRYLWNTYSDPGFSYEADNLHPTASMTAVGVFCSYLLGCSNDPRVANAFDYLNRKTLKDNQDWYRIYFTTQALFQGGSSRWPTWNKQLQQDLLQKQDVDGHWPVLSGLMPGEVFATAMGALVFETYYRYPLLNASGDYNLTE